jgi:hypothetical protein
MAIKTPSQMSPYAQAFTQIQQEDAYVDPSIQAARDERARVEAKMNELIVNGGVGPDTALAMAKDLNSIEKKTYLAQVEEQRLALRDQNYKADVHLQTLKQQEDYQNALEELNNIDTQNVKAKDQYTQWQAKHLNAINGPNKNLSANLQMMAKQFNDNVDAYAGGVSSYLSKYEMSGVPQEAIDAETGRVNFAKIDEIGYPRFDAMRRKRDEEQRAVKVADATALADVQLKKQLQLDTEREDTRIEREKRAAESPEGQAKLSRQRLTDLQAVEKLTKGIPLRLLQSDEEITDATEKYYSARQDKSGKFVKDPNGDFRVYENRKDKKNPFVAIPKSAIDEAIKLIPSTPSPATPSKTTNQPLTKEVVSALADELGASATKQNLMDLARKRGYTF